MENRSTSQRPPFEGGSGSEAESQPESSASPGEASVELPFPSVPVGCSEALGSAPMSVTLLNMEELPPPKPDFSAPPPYDVAAKLPTYEEVQREKSRIREPRSNNDQPSASSPQSLTFLAIDSEGQENDNESGLLGTDFMFFTAFLGTVFHYQMLCIIFMKHFCGWLKLAEINPECVLEQTVLESGEFWPGYRDTDRILYIRSYTLAFVAFLFNWIGFLLLMCFCHTIAARYGALSGFGLSLAKWTLIVKHSTDLASRENSWLWWLIMAFGLLIFVRAIIQYLNIKRGWRLLSGSAQERLLFFY